MLEFQVDDLLKSREKVQASFSLVPQMKRHSNSSNLGASAVEEKAGTSEESPNRDKSNKKKWFGMTFKAERKI